MKHIPFLATLALCTALPLSAQQLKPEVKSSAGGHHSNSSVSLSWTLGELMVQSYAKDAVRLTQGFHQPTITVSSLEELPELKGKISIYPNPASEFLLINLDADTGICTAELTALTGESVYKGEFSGGNHKIDMQPVANGSYVLTIQSQSGKKLVSQLVQKLH